MKYVEGTLIEIKKNSIWKKDITPFKMEKVLTFKYDIIIKDDAGNIYELECNDIEMLEKNKYYFIFYSNKIAKEIYDSDEYFEEILDGDIKNRSIIKEKSSFIISILAIFLVILFFSCIGIIGSILINVPFLVMLNIFMGKEEFDVFIKDNNMIIFIISSILSVFISIFCMGSKPSKHKNRKFNLFIKFRKDMCSQMLKNKTEID